TECESVEERDPNSFRPPDTPTSSQPPVSDGPIVAQRPRARDRTRPRTRIAHHPAKLLRTKARRRTVAFSFAPGEPRASSRCRLDNRPYRKCRSQRRLRVGLGRHTLVVFAVDAAGNRDLSPARFAFRVTR